MGLDRYSVAWTAPSRWQVNENWDSYTGWTLRDYVLTPPTGIVVTNPNGQTEAVTAAGSLGQVKWTSKAQAAGAGSAAATTSRVLDANQNVVQLDEYNGNRSCMAYDMDRNLETSRVEGLSAATACEAAQVALPTGARRVSTQWHPDWRLAVKTAEPRRITTLVFNGQPDPFSGGAVASCAPTSAVLPDGKPLVVLCKRVEQATTDETGAQGFTAALQSGVPASTASWTYNATGQVLTETDALNQIVGQMLGEYNATSPVHEFVWLGDTPVAVMTGSGPEPSILYVYADHLNAPRMLIDKADALRWRWMSEPFGTATPEQAPAGLTQVVFNLRFPGQFFDSESGLYDNYFRDYDPTLGRYVQSDPAGLFGGINNYDYVAADPIQNIDTNGLQRYRATLPSSTQTIESIRSYPEVMRLQELIRQVQPNFTYSTISGSGANSFGYWDVVQLNTYYTSLLRTQNSGTCSSSYTAYVSWARREGVDRAWEDEISLILRTGSGSRNWTPQQIKELLQTRRVSGYVGHYINSVAGTPSLASNPNNIRFCRFVFSFLG